MRFITITAWINLLLSGALLSDTLIFGLNPNYETVKETSYNIYGGKGGGTFRYFVNTVSGSKFRIPEAAYIALSHERSNFIAYKSAIFKKVVAISYTFEKEYFHVHTGLLNSSPFGIIVAFFILAISLLNLFPKPIIKSEAFNQTSVILSSFLLAGLLFLFFYNYS